MKIWNWICGRYWVVFEDGDYGKLYYDGKGWTKHRSEAKRYWIEPNLKQEK